MNIQKSYIHHCSKLETNVYQQEVEKESEFYPCNRIPLGSKKQHSPGRAATWMSLKIIVLNERRQTQKKYILYNSIYNTL